MSRHVLAGNKCFRFENIYGRSLLYIDRELNQDDQGFIDYDDNEDEDKENLAPPAGESLEPQKLLWVEKYSPRGYTDLLSEEVDI